MAKRLTMRWSDVPVIIDIQFAMVLLGLSRPTVLRLCQQGALPAVKFGAQWRISREKLREYMEPSNKTDRAERMSKVENNS